MGLIVPTVRHPERDDQPLPYDGFVGLDGGAEQHQVCVLDRDLIRVGERVVDPDGASLAQLAAWLWTLSAGQPGRVAVAIEVPRGAIVAGLVDRGFHVFAINPKPLARCRDRHTMSGAKDDRRDAFVLADSVRTDPPSFHRVQLGAPQLLWLRELSRAEAMLLEEFRRRANRLRDQWHRFDPQMLKLCHAADESWLWDLIELAPTPAHAAWLREEQVHRVLKVMSRTDLASHPSRQGPRGADVLTGAGAAGCPWRHRSGSGPLRALTAVSAGAGRATSGL